MKLSTATLGLVCALLLGSRLVAEEEGPPAPVGPGFLRDRGPGVATSLLGTGLRPGELLVYLSFEHFRNRAHQYSPSEFGLASDGDFRGDWRTLEGVLLLGYGLTDSLAVELEPALTKASFRKSSDDASSLPAQLRESGLGDVQAQITWRCLRESAHRPELFIFTQMVFPHDDQKRLIGTGGVRLLPGIGVARGFGWGTLMARTTLEYDFASGSPLDWGEWSAEYLRQVSRSWRVRVGMEGQIGGASNLDEVWLNTEVQWQLKPGVALKLSNGLGLTKHASGWAPEIGILVRLPRR